MQISVLINAHENSPTLSDTIDSIKFNLSKNILLNIDGGSKDIFNYKDVYKIEGFIHNNKTSPYRNLALGLWKLYQTWQDSDWYMYSEPDCLFCSNEILKKLENNKNWILGNSLKIEKIKDKFNNGNFTFLEKLIGKSPKEEMFYLLGCCLFFNSIFIKKLVDIDFFNRFIFYTNNFHEGKYPGYNGSDISEHLYSTLAYNLGGTIDELANLNKKYLNNECIKYYMRRSPDADVIDFNYCKKSYIIHPVKSENNIIRIYHKQRRLCSII